MMKLSIKILQWLIVIALSWGAVACADSADIAANDAADVVKRESAAITENPAVADIALDVYKSPTCGCCEDWVTHIEAAGFKAALHHPADLNQLKADKGIAPRYQSCHTAVSQDGYVFEGHIPADIIQRFLANPPDGALGLAVPGMPVGSPGMEMGKRFDAYDVWLLDKAGNHRVYQHIAGKR